MKQAQQREGSSANRQTSFISRLFLLWTNDYVKLCDEKKLGADDITEVDPSEAFSQTYSRWNSLWQQSANFKSVDEESGERLKWTMRKTFQKQLIFGTLLSFISYQSSALTPLIVYKISQLIDEESLNFNQSIIILIIISVLKITKSFFTMHSYYILKKLGGNIFCCLCYSLTQKSLELLNLPQGQATISQRAKLAQYDCSKIVEYPLIWNEILFQSYSLVFAIICLFFMANWQSLVSCVVLFALNIVSYILISAFKRHLIQVHKAASNRIKKETQSINNMKFIKVNALEDFFFKKINALREFQVSLLQKFLNKGVLVAVLQYIASGFSIAVFIFLYTLSGKSINPALIFSILLFYNNMALYKLMNRTNNLVDINISIAKIEDYLVHQKKDCSYISRSNQLKELSITVRNGNFYWEKQGNNQVSGEIMFNLKGINLQISKGEFIALIGEYGSGKSSILNAILGQMSNETSKVTINGSIAYASQTPWILNESVKNNILFGQPFEQGKYKRVLYYSRLETDLKLFTNGQQTVIGEKGSTLSGGQRARISLARALYNEADIYILDDILSALDAHVSAFIFQETLTKYLKNRTILLATHMQKYLSLVDRVFMVQQGRIKQCKPKGQFETQKQSDKKLQNRRQSEEKKDAPLKKRSSCNDQEHQQKIVIQSMAHQRKELIEKAQKSQQEVFRIFIRRRGGILFVVRTIFFVILMIAANLVIILWLNFWVNSPDNTNQYYFQVFLMILGVCVASMAGFSLAEFNSDFFNEYHRAMIRHIFTAPMSYFESISISNSMNKLSNDLTRVDGLLIIYWRDTIFFFCIGATFLTNSLITYFRKDQKLTIILILALILLIIYYYYFFTTAIRQLHNLEAQSQIPIFSSFVEILTGSSTIRAFNKQEHMKERQKSKIERFLMIQKTHAGIQSYFTFIISMVTKIITTILVAKILILKGQDKVDFFLIYNLFQFQRSVETIHRFLSQFLSNLKYLGYCEQLMEIPQEQGYDLTEINGQLQFKKRVSNSDWIKEGNISFEDYSVKYRPELQTVLKGLTLNIKPKEKIGVVGRTGSGKSTTILSLLRILQVHQGSIKIDDIDIYSLDIQTLRVGFSIILQEHFLFSGTVRENIDPLHEFEYEKIIHSLQLCGLWDSLKERSGLSTVVQENGSNFSAGEKQLVSISRTLLNPKKIVLVDEATASIDYKTDETIQRVIKQLLRDSTVFTIAHRIDTILGYDQILVLDNGKVAEYGSPSELLQTKSSVFRKLYNQSKNPLIESPLYN